MKFVAPEARLPFRMPLYGSYTAVVEIHMHSLHRTIDVYYYHIQTSLTTTGLNKSSTPGSFIRPARKPDPSRSFSEALKAKYASDPVQDPSIHIVFATKPGDNALKKDPLARINQPIRISGKEVEEVGFDKIRKQLAQLSELKIVILDGLRMERPSARLKDGEEEWETGLTDVDEACPKATELDLSRNLFEEWREIPSICEQLPKLRTLRVEYVLLILSSSHLPN